MLYPFSGHPTIYMCPSLGNGFCANFTHYTLDVRGFEMIVLLTGEILKVIDADNSTPYKITGRIGDRRKCGCLM